tara:strand:- start:12380 stop:12934 length:555 start_codon:yes stop_codon:yes gene_type:complete
VITMPITKKKDGYYWGSKGPFKTRKKAVQVAQAAYASGYVKKEWKEILKKDMSYCVCSGPNKTKGFTCKAHCRSKEMKKADPKKGTGKKPKGSARRLYTDENPKDTVSVKFRTAKDVRDTFSSASFKSKPHKRQSQIINLVEQRARVAAKRAKDPEAKKRLNAAHKVALARKESSKRKTARMKK